MKSGDIEILRVYLCTLDGTLPCAHFDEVKLDEDDALYRYTAKLCAAALSDTSAKTATYEEGAYASELMPTDPEGMDAMVGTVCERIYDLMASNPTIGAGSGIFAFFLAEEIAYVSLFKLPFQEMYNCRLDAEGHVSWILNSKVMPKPGLKNCEYFAVNVMNRKVRVADIECYIDDVRVNYLAESVLELSRPAPSEKKTVEAIRETTAEVIRECYPKEQVPEKMMEYRKEVAAGVEQSGRVSVAAIEKTVFSDSEVAGERYRERIEQERIQREPIAVSPKTERSLTKKQKIVTDNGIEILVPVAYLRNPDYVEYVQGEDGKITILLKDIHSIDL